ncbi:hypothetical protein L208DRAFT_1400137 [Tricholoma matsutake]|nr:hypothetical protein L208DRAFT_1400137 [Tricholoma matsutake 945]
MASLPPKPLDSPSTHREERHHPIDDNDSHPARPMASQSRYHEWLSMSDCIYVPHTQSSEYNSYVAPAYDRRREDDMWRRDYADWERDRGHGIWERSRDREHGSRFGEPSQEYDRDRRGCTRERGHDRDRTHYPPHDRHRDSYDRCDHKPSSPARPDASYRRLLEHQSSPRSQSPLRNVHELPDASRASESHTMAVHNHSSTIPSLSQYPEETQENSSSKPATDDLENRGSPGSSQSEHLTEMLYLPQLQQRPESVQHDHKESTSIVLPAGFDNKEAIIRKAIIHMDPKRDEKDRKSDTKMVDRSLSPPKHPQFRDAQPPNTMQHRHKSRSPPRGPQNHSRNIAIPAFREVCASQHPLPTSVVSQDPTPAISPVEPPGLPVASDLKVTLPTITAYKPWPSLTPELDTKIMRLQTHRAHLASEYLDTATLDLRAAESRRKVVDSQMEKAHAGVLGIDTVVQLL